jgi:acetyl-CoA acyltransferase
MEKSSRDVVIVDGVRTPFAKAGTKFKDVHAAELGQVALQELIARTNLDAETVDEVIVGCVGNPSDAVNIGRVVALRAGIPQKTSAHTVHRNCASALESISTGFDKIKAGVVDTVVAGGTENMSQAPLLFNQRFADIFGEFATAKTMGKKLNALSKLKLKYLTPRISIVEALKDPFVGINMGQTAEILAKEFHITREEQDHFAMTSHHRAVAATKEGRLQEEMTPVYIGPKYKEVVEEDVGPRDGQSMEALKKLRPYFDRKTGTITVGNACPLTDGAAMVLMMSREKAEAEGYKPLVRVRGYGFAGLEPERMGLGPVYSTPLALKRAGLSLKDMDLVELNEAFAAQVLACQKAFASQSFAKEKLGLSEAVGELDLDKVNVNGGAIALGHPVGATGTRLVLTLMKEMKRRGSQFGLATLCIGGGQGGAMVLENEG